MAWDDVRKQLLARRREPAQRGENVRAAPCADCSAAC
jgi:hypothetical protein